MALLLFSQQLFFVFFLFSGCPRLNYDMYGDMYFSYFYHTFSVTIAEVTFIENISLQNSKIIMGVKIIFNPNCEFEFASCQKYIHFLMATKCYLSHRNCIWLYAKSVNFCILNFRLKLKESGKKFPRKLKTCLNKSFKDRSPTHMFNGNLWR